MINRSKLHSVMTSGHGTTKSCAKINFHHRQDNFVSLHRQYNLVISEMFGRLSIIRARYNLPRSRFKPIQISWIQNFGSEGGNKERALPTAEVWRSKSSCIFANLALEDWLYRRYCMARSLKFTHTAHMCGGLSKFGMTKS